MKESSIAQQCLDILKRDDVKKEIKLLFSPILEFILYEINPYIYLTVTLVFLIFMMILAILLILLFQLRYKNSFYEKL